MSLIKNLSVYNFEMVSIFDDDVVHMHGFELSKILRERNKVDRRSLMKLQQIWIIVIPLPTQRHQFLFQRFV